MKPADPAPKTAVWITPREAAEYLNVGVDIIYDGCAVRGLTDVCLGHRRIRLRREWLDAWAEAHTRIPK
jgi:excisionase family DNA binding protein